MAFSSLSQTAQDVIMVQFEFFGKMFIIGFFFVGAIFYINQRKKFKDTPYLLVALVRTILLSLSWITIYFTPLFIVFLYPQQSIDRMLEFQFLFYRYATLVIGLVVFFNVLFFSPLIIAKLGGLNIMSKNTNKIIEQIFGKHKKLFRRI